MENFNKQNPHVIIDVNQSDIVASHRNRIEINKNTPSKEDEEVLKHYLINCICYSTGIFLFFTIFNWEIIEKRDLKISLLSLLSLIVLMIFKNIYTYMKSSSEK